MTSCLCLPGASMLSLLEPFHFLDIISQSGYQLGDSWRKSRMGMPLLRAVLLEVKGEWKQVKTCYGLPGWIGNADSPICWRCTALKRSFWEESGPKSSWVRPEARLSPFPRLLKKHHNPEFAVCAAIAS